MDKKELRREITAWYAGLPGDEIRAMSRDAALVLTKEQIWRDSPQILLFLTFGRELETEFLLRAAFGEGKQIAVPRIYGKEMKFHYLRSMDDRLETNRWNIREPLVETPVWIPEKGNTLMVTPGLAFGLRGERLGRGGGFYDRFLERNGGFLYTTGICFEYQLREGIPAEQHDRRVDSVCTDKRFLRFTPA